jgi:hypothetical protein
MAELDSRPREMRKMMAKMMAKARAMTETTDEASVKPDHNQIGSSRSRLLSTLDGEDFTH